MRPGRWWNDTLPKAMASLVVALSVAFLPLAVNEVRARRRAKPIQIVATASDRAKLEYQVRVRVTTSPADSIVVTIGLTDASLDSAARSLVNGRCPVLLQLRTSAERDGPTRWQGRGRTCSAGGREKGFDVAQGDVLRSAVSVHDVLGDSLPAGRYAVSVLFGVGGELLTRDAGDVTLTRVRR